jgi:hypothetical protein
MLQSNPLHPPPLKNVFPAEQFMITPVMYFFFLSSYMYESKYKVSLWGDWIVSGYLFFWFGYLALCINYT